MYFVFVFVFLSSSPSAGKTICVSVHFVFVFASSLHYILNLQGSFSSCEMDIIRSSLQGRIFGLQPRRHAPCEEEDGGGDLGKRFCSTVTKLRKIFAQKMYFMKEIKSI